MSCTLGLRKEKNIPIFSTVVLFKERMYINYRKKDKLFCLAFFTSQNIHLFIFYIICMNLSFHAWN